MKLWQDFIEFFLLERLGSIFRQVRCESRDTGVRWTSSGCRFFERHLSQALGNFDAHEVGTDRSIDRALDGAEVQVPSGSISDQ